LSNGQSLTFNTAATQRGLFRTPPTLVFSTHYVVNSSLQSAQSQEATGAHAHLPTGWNIAAACRNIGTLSEAISIPITTSMQKFEKHQEVSRYLFQREKNTRQQYICISINTSTKLGFRLVLNIYHNISKWCAVSNCVQSPISKHHNIQAAYIILTANTIECTAQSQRISPRSK